MFTGLFCLELLWMQLLFRSQVSDGPVRHYKLVTSKRHKYTSPSPTKNVVMERSARDQEWAERIAGGGRKIDLSANWCACHYAYLSGRPIHPSFSSQFQMRIATIKSASTSLSLSFRYLKKSNHICFFHKVKEKF